MTDKKISESILQTLKALFASGDRSFATRQFNRVVAEEMRRNETVIRSSSDSLEKIQLRIPTQENKSQPKGGADESDLPESTLPT